MGRTARKLERLVEAEFALLYQTQCGHGRHELADRAGLKAGVLGDRLLFFRLQDTIAAGPFQLSFVNQRDAQPGNVGPVHPPQHFVPGLLVVCGERHERSGQETDRLERDTLLLKVLNR